MLKDQNLFPPQKLKVMIKVLCVEFVNKNVIWWFHFFIGLSRVVSWNDHDVPPTLKVLFSHLARWNAKLMKGQL
jgi:hypothetical protein